MIFQMVDKNNILYIIYVYKFPYGNMNYVRGDIKIAKEFYMKIKRTSWLLLFVITIFAIAFFGCASTNGGTSSSSSKNEYSPLAGLMGVNFDQIMEKFPNATPDGSNNQLVVNPINISGESLRIIFSLRDNAVYHLRLTPNDKYNKVQGDRAFDTMSRTYTAEYGQMVDSKNENQGVFSTKPSTWANGSNNITISAIIIGDSTTWYVRYYNPLDEQTE